eukprot:GILJ01032662.1.p1 GENE.GILJ01032662.1~~GILJ01032662.1.p1  ORF type:complete len:487 (-),score=41.73 GILJ01032662.1:23-1483(-)
MLTENVDSGCTLKYPSLCWDGSCQTEYSKCAPIDACPLAAPLRCSDGLCIDPTIRSCNLVADCQSGHRCADGICRANCPSFNGCPVDMPFHCPDASCGLDIESCVSSSACANASFVRCANGVCVHTSNMTACRPPVRGYLAESFQVSVGPSQANVPVVYNGSTILTSLTIPSGTFFNANRTSSVDLQLKSVSESIVKNVTNVIHETRRAEFGDSQLLSYEQSVVSPVFACEVPSNMPDQFQFQISVETIVEKTSSMAISDLCLAYIDTVNNTWVCDNRVLNYSTNGNGKLVGYINHCSAHAIVYMPIAQYAPVSPEICDTFCQNKLWIAVGGAASILFLLLGIYVCCRICRYRRKYKDTKDQMVEMADELHGMKNLTTTGAIGETLGDRAQGITFTPNPLAVAQGRIPTNVADGVPRTAYETLLQHSQMLEQQVGSVSQHNSYLQVEVDRLTQQLMRAKQDNELRGTSRPEAAPARHEFAAQPARR